MFITNKNLNHYLLFASLSWNKNLSNFQKAENAITPTSRTKNNADYLR